MNPKDIAAARSLLNAEAGRARQASMTKAERSEFARAGAIASNEARKKKKKAAAKKT